METINKNDENIFKILKDYSISKNKKIQKTMDVYGNMMIKEISQRIYKAAKDNEKILYDSKDGIPVYIYAILQNIYCLIGLDIAVKKMNEKAENKIKPWNLIDKNGNNILHVAIKTGKNEELKYILSKIEIDINIKDSNGRTVLMNAIKNKNAQAVKILLKNKDIKIDEKDTNGDTALHYAINFNGQSAMEIFEEIIKHNGKIDEINKRNLTPLALSIYKNKKEMAIKLLNKGGTELLRYVNDKKQLIDLIVEMRNNKLPIEKHILRYMQSQKYKKKGIKRKEEYKKILSRISDNYKNLCEKTEKEFDMKELISFAKGLNIKYETEDGKQKSKKDICKMIAYKVITFKRNPELLHEIFDEKN
jgi:hypothetical protein